eukprot:3680167-Pyramimonas_sp.AAC.1
MTALANNEPLLRDDGAGAGDGCVAARLRGGHPPGGNADQTGAAHHPPTRGAGGARHPPPPKNLAR